MLRPFNNKSAETIGGGMTRRSGAVLCHNVGMFVLVSLLMSVALTGVLWHEWLGLVFSALVLLHILSRWQWFSEQFRRVLMPGAHRARLNWFLNFTLLVMMTTLLSSGIFISHQFSPLAGEHFGRMPVWKEIHNWSSIAVMVSVGLHLGLNWDWMIGKIHRNGLKRAAPAEMNLRPPNRISNLRNRLVAGLAIVIIAGLGVFASYLATTAMMKPQTAQMSVQSRHDTINVSGRIAGRTSPQREQPQTRRGIILFGSNLLGLLAMAIVARFVFHIRL
jgi:hypothetical protein